MNYQIAIPTYGRADAIRKYTLKYLEQTDIPRERVTLFVASEQEKEKYQSSNPGYNIVVGVKGLCPQRLFISQHYPKGTPVVSFDDDVSGICELRLGERLFSQQKPLDHPCSLETVTALDAFIQDGFKLAQDHEVEMWGCYQVANKGFMHPKISVGLKFIMGHFFGFYAGDPVFEEIKDYPCKDDFYWSLWHQVNRKGTLRLDYCCVKSKAHSGSGGTNEDMERKLETNNATVDRIVQKYPELASVKMRNTKDSWLSRYKELRLKNVTRVTIPVLDELNAKVA